MRSREAAPPEVEIRRLGSADQARLCARMMAASEPWITLKRGYAESLAIVEDSSREVHVAREEGEIRGFLVLNMSGAFAGYIQTVCVAPEARSRGIGSRLMQFAEERIFRESPNVFLCVSSFNPRSSFPLIWLGRSQKKTTRRPESPPRGSSFGRRRRALR